MPKPPPTTDVASRLDDYRWLIGPQARPWLEMAAASTQPLVRLADALRRDLSKTRAHLVLEQAALRAKAVAKFPAAERMFFTSSGLQQATDGWVARYKAARFAEHSHVLDLCTGIGGDLLALAEHRDAVGVDRDPVLALLAEANARAILGTSAPTVLVRDVQAIDVRQCDAWHLDPDRRPGGKRTTRVEWSDPPLETIERLVAQNDNAAIKLAPAAKTPQSWAQRAHLEWLSRDGQCRQLVAWFGSLAQDAGGRRATVLDRSGNVLRTLTGGVTEPPEPAGNIARYVFEPDPAVLAADLTGALAAEQSLAPLAHGSVYLTGDMPIDDGALARFEVLEVAPYRLKPLAALLRTRGIGKLEIKKRGVDDDPAEIRRALRLEGEHAATLFVTRIGRRALAIVARRRDSG